MDGIGIASQKHVTKTIFADGADLTCLTYIPVSLPLTCLASLHLIPISFLSFLIFPSSSLSLLSLSLSLSVSLSLFLSLLLSLSLSLSSSFAKSRRNVTVPRALMLIVSTVFVYYHFRTAFRVFFKLYIDFLNDVYS